MALCVPEKGALSQKSRGLRTFHGVPDPHILSGPLSGEGTDTPPGGSGATTYPQAQARARLRDFLGKTRPPTAFNAGGEVRSTTTEPEVTFARLYY